MIDDGNDDDIDDDDDDVDGGGGGGGDGGEYTREGGRKEVGLPVPNYLTRLLLPPSSFTYQVREDDGHIGSHR